MSDYYLQMDKWDKMSKAKSENDFLIALKSSITWKFPEDWDYLLELQTYLEYRENKYITNSEMQRYINGERGLFELRDKYDELADALTEEERLKILNDNMFGV